MIPFQIIQIYNSDVINGIYLLKKAIDNDDLFRQIALFLYDKEYTCLDIPQGKDYRYDDDFDTNDFNINNEIKIKITMIWKKYERSTNMFFQIKYYPNDESDVEYLSMFDNKKRINKELVKIIKNIH